MLDFGDKLVQIDFGVGFGSLWFGANMTLGIDIEISITPMADVVDSPGIVDGPVIHSDEIVAVGQENRVLFAAFLWARIDTLSIL